MRKLLVLSFLFSTMGLSAKNSTSSNLDYVKNEGQWETPVLYKTDLHGGWAFLEKNAITYKFLEQTHLHPSKGKHTDQIRGHAFKINWLNANPDVKVKGNDQQPYYNNYFIGNNESKWRSNVGIYRTILYNNIYANIDFKIYSEDALMKSDYIVRQGGNPGDLRFEYQGVDGISLESDGRLKISTSINTLFELKPYAYQIIKGRQKEIKCRYVLEGNILSFQLPDGYNKNYDLIIDPTLVFSTYSGSFSDNWGSSATHDNNGNMYLGGISLGSLYPVTTGAFQTSFNGGSGSEPSDIVITKFNATGTTRLYSTYLGGSSNELLASLISTPNNELIAVMTTSSRDFPTTANAYDRTFNGGSSLTAYEINLPNGSDVAVTKLNAAGSALVGSTYYGGSGNDGTNTSSLTAFNYGDESRSDVAIDNNGNVYITSTTTSSNLPGTSGKAQPSNGGGGSDGLVAKFNSDLSALSWATYYGGSGTDASYSMALDKNNNIFICGGTSSSNLPGSNSGVNTTFKGGTTDGFVAKLNNNGTAVLSSTYLGTNDYDQAYILDLDNNDNVYIFGQTLGNYPVSAGVYSNTGGKQFINKLNNSLNATSFSTVFGSINSSTINITPTALLVDVCGNIYAVGWGGNVNYQGFTDGMAVTADAYKSTTDGSDFYLINFNANATSLKYATFFGEDGGIGDHVDGGTSRFDKNGIVYEAVCASCGASNSFPVTPGVVSSTNNSDNCNMAGFKFNFDLTALQIITATATPPTGCAPLNVSFTYTSTRPGTQYFWDFGDNTSSTVQFPSHTYSNSGTYTVRFILRDPNNCNPVDSTTLTVTVKAKKNSTIDQTICQGQSVTIGNQVFSTTGNYTITFRSAEGCDSVVTLHLTVNNRIINNITRSVCPGGSVVVGNHTYTQSGSYKDTLRSFFGCDSIVNLTLIVNPNKTVNLSRTICAGQSVSIGNQTYSTTGNYSVTIRSAQGCDSTINLSLLVIPNKSTDISRTICEGQSVSIGNQTFSTAGNYAVTLSSAQGCDSVVHLSLLVNPKKTTNISRTICDGGSVSIGNETFTTSGNYSVTFQSAQGCDSIVRLSLTVNPVKRTQLNYTVCTGTVITIGNQPFSTSGNYTVTLSSSLGCDSIIQLSLLEKDTLSETINRTICKGQNYTIGNQSFEQPGNYEVTIKAAAGCDSTVYLSLSVLDTARESISRTICEGDSITVGSQIFQDAGNYTVSLPSAAGCDSLVYVSLTVLEKKTAALSASICQGETFSLGNQTFNQTGNYTIHLVSAEGCDSAVSLTLTVNPLPMIDAVADRNSALATQQIQLNVITSESLSYNWSPADLLNNATLQNPTAYITAPTWFYVTATNTTTQCITRDSVFIDLDYLPCTKENIFIPDAFTPNGDGVNDKFYIRTTILKVMHLEIYDRWGHKVFETDSITEGWDGTYKGQPEMMDAYGYYLRGECIQGGKISAKGNLSLIK